MLFSHAETAEHRPHDLLLGGAARQFDDGIKRLFRIGADSGLTPDAVLTYAVETRGALGELKGRSDKGATV